MARLPTCQRREGALGDPPLKRRPPRKDAGAKEALSEFGTAVRCLGAKEQVVGSSGPGARRSAGLPADPGKEPELGGAWGRVAQLRSRWVGLLQSSGRSGNRLSPRPSLFHPQTGVGRSEGLGGRTGCPAGGARGGSARCAAGQVLDLAEGGDLGQTLVGGRARVVPAARLAPVLGTPVPESRSQGLKIFWKESLKSCPLSGALRTPPTPISFGKVSCAPLPWTRPCQTCERKYCFYIYFPLGEGNKGECSDSQGISFPLVSRF